MRLPGVFQFLNQPKISLYGREKFYYFLYPVLQQNGLGHIELYIWDHNKERVYERTCDIVDETTKDMVAGVAFHWYSGDHFDTLQMVREDYPELKLMHSEGCVEWSRGEEFACDDARHAPVFRRSTRKIP